MKASPKSSSMRPVTSKEMIWDLIFNLDSIACEEYYIKETLVRAHPIRRACHEARLVLENAEGHGSNQVSFNQHIPVAMATSREEPLPRYGHLA